MSLCITEQNSYLCSNDLESERDIKEMETSTAMDLSTLTLNFRALNILDKSLNIVSKISANFDNSSPDTTAGNKMDNRNITNDNKIPIISLSEVSWHDTIDDCWIVICDYVYDVTNFIKNHPGGHDVLLEYAGRDATLAFIGSGHSKEADRMLKKFLIGELPFSERIFRTPNGIKVGDCA